MWNVTGLVVVGSAWGWGMSAQLLSGIVGFLVCFCFLFGWVLRQGLST